VVLGLLLAGPALAQKAHPYAKWADEFDIDLNASYDGTRVMEMSEGTFEFVEHKAPGKMYTQVEMQGMSSGIILREDLGKGYLLMPSMGMYKETSLEEGMMQSSNGLEFQSIEEVGREDVLGFPSTKYKTRFTDKEGKGAGHFWVTDGGVPIKMDMIYTSSEVEGMRMTMEFIELNMREQDPAIFELPAGLKPMSFGGMTGLSEMMKQGNDGSAAGPGGSALSDALNQLSPDQKEALSGAGLGSLIPGMGGDSQEQAAPAGSAGGAAKQSSSMSKQLTTGDMTQSVQLHLQYLGIDPGNTSGDLSVDTQIAISEFQASKGMKVTGEVTPQLLGVLSAEVDSDQ
jgi:hypothetical protein